ncbi:site-specific recombinase [Variovorax sp. YR752]|uniref:site-specific recombinase n=1 Tax=Variovorax sp. YR752 TaxID=1884383 RepID=UPI003137CBBC
MARTGSGWDLTALLNAADPKAPLAERQLWLVRLMEWLRRAPVEGEAARNTPLPVLRLKHLLNVLQRNQPQRDAVGAVLARFWREVDTVALLADFGFSPRMNFFGELGQRLRLRLLPITPETQDLGELFALLFPRERDAHWLAAIDDETLARLTELLAPMLAGWQGAANDWRTPLLDSIAYLAAAVRASGHAGALRQRMSAELLADDPFRQLASAAERLAERARDAEPTALLQEASYLRALLDACRRCASSVRAHLEQFGVSIDVVFEVDQLRARCERIEALLNTLLAPQPARELLHLIASLAQQAEARRGIRSLFARHYSLLARKVAERGAETGEHYITRDRTEYGAMLRAAAGGGAVIVATTFVKFLVGALGFAAFWAGLLAGINYAASFVIIHLLHWTVATKQPAMTAPAMAEKLSDVSDDSRVEAFVNEVAHLIRSQAAGIFGNLMVAGPGVLAVQLGTQALFGQPLVGTESAEYVLHSLTLLGPTALYAAFTGVLLFASSLIAGWAENWFVWHRLDSAIAWNPRSIALLGAARARRWGAWWRANISGLAANISLGLMLGLVPALASFFALPIEVRHVTLSTGQLAAALGALGTGVLHEAAFWWCAAGIAVTGVLNLTVSFVLAFKVALRSRGIRLADRSRIYRAIRARMRRQPLSFVLPPKESL